MSWSKPFTLAQLVQLDIKPDMIDFWRQAGLVKPAAIRVRDESMPTAMVTCLVYSVQGLDPDDPVSIERIDQKARAINGLKVMDDGADDGNVDTATGAALDNIAQVYGLSRQMEVTPIYDYYLGEANPRVDGRAEMENDNALRTRIRMHLEAARNDWKRSLRSFKP